MNQLLSTPITLTGPVVRGERRGRSLGFPTANIELAHISLPSGIYAGVAYVAHERAMRYMAAIHIGPRPTFNNNVPVVEVHLLHFPDHDLYEQILTVEVIAHLRAIKKFTSVAALQTAIAEDCRAVTTLLTAQVRQALV